MTNGFRIIGVRVLEGCPQYIRKALHEGELYLLYNDFTEDEQNMYTLKKIVGRLSNTACQLYNQVDASEEHEIHVNVSAIVGKNGDGKSSLVEIVLRILNNFACQTGFLMDQRSLRMIKNLRAILYYEIDDDLYAISSEGEHSTVNLWKNGQRILNINPKWDDEMRKRYLKRTHINDLFYTTVINYSIYAYNSKLLKGETIGEGSWIDALFHKNDEYQTSVVLNPMRTDGNIDINNEEYLSRQRLLSLMVNALPEDEILKINDQQKAVGYNFSIEKESKLINKSIIYYFHSVSKDYLSWDTVDSVINGEYTDQQGINNMVSHFCDFFEWFITKVQENEQLFLLLQDMEIIKDDHNKHTDWHNYLDFFANWTEKHYTEVGKFAIFKDKIKRISRSFIAWMNYSQVYRILLIIRIWEHFTQELPDLFSTSLNETISNRQIPDNAAKLYLVYKIIEITSRYSPYNSRSYIRDNSYETAVNKYDKVLAFKTLDRDIDVILHTNDYITLKLRQSLHYLQFVIKFPNGILYGAEEPVADYAHNGEEDDFEQYKKTKQYFISFQQLNDNIKKFKGKVLSKDVIQFLPPPIFIGDIIIENTQGEQFPYSSLSSGQLQKWNTVGALMYHLRNLNDEPEGEYLIHYKHINLILEEVELYFHPEFQREFVSYVLEMIHRSSLPNIDSINICFVTHSPFILSDILRNNTLYLENGHSVNKRYKEETFGANLYDLMVNSFFLQDNAMGQFASEKIKEIIIKYNTQGVVPSEEKKLVGDTIIRNYLNGRGLR